MKRALIALLLTSAVAQAAPVTNKNLVSFMNFGMPAMKITNQQASGEIQIVVQDAVLRYADNTEMMNPKQHAEIERILDMTDLNALVLTIPESACTQHDTLSNVVNCSSNGEVSVKVQGARASFNGKITKTGTKTLTTKWLTTGVKKVHEIRADGEADTLTGYLGFLLEEGGDSIAINLLKSGLSPR